LATDIDMPRRRKVAEFRYSIIGTLFSSPPRKGELAERLRGIASRDWTYPDKQVSERISVRTLERWYQAAKKNRADPIAALLPAKRSDFGRAVALTGEHIAWLRENFRNNSSWSWRLHADNLADTGIIPVASYSTVLRWMKKNSYIPARNNKKKSAFKREVKLYESMYSGELFHFDFHKGSRKVLHPSGEYVQPYCVAFIDDRSRLVAHCQLFYGESAEELVHACIQAILKRGLPRKMMSDNGSAMTSGEFIAGMNRLAVEHNLTQIYSPHQNGKIESFWIPLEGRLLKMLSHVKPLTLDKLNRFTQAWVEEDYNNKRHSETGEKPLTRYLDGKDVLRPAPDYDTLRKAFRTPVKRQQRRSDNTISIDSVRFEVPLQYRHIPEIIVAYSRWDLSSVTIICSDTHEPVCEIYPADLNRNASGLRAALPHREQDATEKQNEDHSNSLPPTLARCLRDFEEKTSLSGYIPLERNSER